MDVERPSTISAASEGASLTLVSEVPHIFLVRGGRLLRPPCWH